MEAIGKIGVIIPELYDSLDLELMQGIHHHAKRLGYDVLIFTDACNKTDQYQVYPDVISFNNIYQLAFQANLDGILFCAARFLSQTQKSLIYHALQQRSIPCLVLGEATDLLPYETFSQTESMYLMTKHLLEDHHYRKIYCLTGFPDDVNSNARLAGFRQAMEECGLSVDESMVFYGAFWKEQSYQLGVDIAAGRVAKPEAIVCASDTMAVSLCEALRQHGIAVPEDIAVTGYDGSFHTAICSPKITTICGRDRQLGAKAMCRLHEMITGETTAAALPSQYIWYGTTCGCTPRLKDADNTAELYFYNILQQWYDRKVYMPFNIISVLSTAEVLDELMNTIYGYSYLLEPIREYAICLCEDWKFDFENPAVYRTQGFSEHMHIALKRSAAGMEKEIPFASRELLPELSQPHDPQLLVFTSLHQDTQIFGYVAAKFEDAAQICIDEHFMNWTNAIANGLDKLQKRMYKRYIRKQLAALSVHDPSTGLYNKRGFLEQLPRFLSKRECVLLLLAYPKEAEAGLDAFPARHTLVANALRLSAAPEELLCRLDQQVFAVAAAVEASQDLKRFTDKRIMLLEEQMRALVGALPQQQMPEFLTICRPLGDSKLTDAEAMIEEQLHLLQGRAAAFSDTSGHYLEKLHQLHREIWSTPQKDWNVTDMAERIGISTSHFQKIYKKEFGLGCSKDIIHARIEKAKWLLLHTELRVQEIAAACGYHDNSHFMRQFKEKVGVSALQYRGMQDAQS